MEERAKLRAERKALVEEKKRKAETEKLVSNAFYTIIICKKIHLLAFYMLKAKLKHEQQQKEEEIMREKQEALKKRREEKRLEQQVNN